MKNIAIIPARGGSKRIPRKNIRPFLGKPIIAYSIEIALNSELFDEVMVSTDDEEIAEIAKKYGASVPFMRSSDNANDYATLNDVVEEVLMLYENKELSFDNVCCILPTAPLISIQQMTVAYKKLLSGYIDSVYPIVAFSYPILRSLEIGEDSRLKMTWPEHLKTRSQDLKPAYHDTGTFYWCRTTAFLQERNLLCKKNGWIELLDYEVQDIDTEVDWRLAELKFKFLNE